MYALLPLLYISSKLHGAKFYMTNVTLTHTHVHVAISSRYL